MEAALSGGDTAGGDPGRRPKRLPRTVRERQILDAAVFVFSQHGYHDASMDEIAEVAGISKPMVYSYLGSKEDLFSASIRREATKVIEAIAETMTPGRTPEMMLYDGFVAFFTFVSQNRDSWRVLHRLAANQGGPFFAEWAEMRDRVIEVVSTLMVHQGSEGGLPEEIAVQGEALAAALVGATESLADWWMDHPEASPRKMAARMMSLVWNGFGDILRGDYWVPPHKR
ncbi:TetR/AcrR family transcriptional regulator [Pseudonocardiaceae bacterium YIM PH 21723]|nr:TetR/AcrR family transcriptional regulator [Pseudonocardiaceae bacterium YIM PH 21723]